MSKNFRQGLYNIIDKPSSFGDDVYVGNYVHIRPNVFIDNKSEIRDHCFIGMKVKIGKNSRVYQFCNICHGTVIGDNCFIGIGTVTLNDKEISYPQKEDFVPNAPIIEDDVRIGARSVILPGVTLATGCRIGAGAVVTKDTEPYKTYKGVPAYA